MNFTKFGNSVPSGNTVKLNDKLLSMLKIYKNAELPHRKSKKKLLSKEKKKRIELSLSQEW